MSDHFCNNSSKIEEAKVEYLPHEIVIEIVLRLPIKSIITWTSVSKSWNSLIKNPNFISTHLNNYNRNHFLLLEKFDEPISFHWDNEAFDEYRRFLLPFQGLSVGASAVVGTCNGLVCLANPNNFFVWNPCIRKYVTGVVGKLGDCIGFGFDSKTNDYKVVRVMTRVNKESPPKVDVYSLATRKWKMVTAVPPTCPVYWQQASFVNGALHWAVLRRTNDGFDNFVLVFDLGDEEFRKIMFPTDLLIEDNLFGFHLSVSVCGESLAALCRTDFSCIHAWVMKEYGVLESWTKVITLDSKDLEPGVEFSFVEALGFRKSGELLIETDEEKLVSVDSESKKIKDLRISAIWGFTVNPYVESLVLLDKSEDVVSY